MSNPNGNEKNNDEEESFEALLESYGSGRSESLKIGDKVKGEIIAIGKDTVFVDTGTKVDGAVEIAELRDEDGVVPYEEGDTLELFVIALDENEVILSKALSGVGGVNLLYEAYEQSIPVEGKVLKTCKGGFHVEIVQRIAFCPFSQMDIRFVDNPDEYLGQSFQFLITKFEERDRNIVLSRRKILEKELHDTKLKFFQEVSVDTVFEGRVTRIMPYGVFVELRPGIEGMIHISQLSWSRLESPEDFISTGDMIKATIMEIDFDETADRLKISLSSKKLVEDPWLTINDQFKPGDRVKGKVMRCLDFGAFMEIAPGIEGLIHISEMSYVKRILRPEEIVEKGDEVYVLIKEIDSDAKRISLSIRDAEGDPWVDVDEKYHVGQSIRGTIERIENYGYFINIEPGITGLLPRSRINASSESAKISKLKVGVSLMINIDAINSHDRKISLSVGNEEDEGDWREYTGQARENMSSLGEKLLRAMEKKR